MSLQVWLPLNGDLHNQGLKNIQPVGNGVTLDDNGKIGSCYSFNGSNSISINQIVLPSQTPNWSFACWFLLTDISLTSANCLFSERTGTVSTGYTIFIYPKTGKILVDDGTRWEVTPMVFSQDTWYHLVITRSPSGKKLYINGQLKNSISTVGNTTAINTNGCLIGLAQSSTSLLTGNQGIVGKLNDVRIYDHCLSQKEVKEISKGLVLHYKLDNYYLDNYFIHPNLLLDTNVNGLTKVNASYNRYYESNGSGSYTCTWKVITDPPVQGINYGLQQKVTTVSGFHSVTWYQNGYVSVTAGTTYTMSCYVKVISGTDLIFKFQYGKSPYVANTQTLKNDNEWHQYSWTFTPNTASGQAAASGTTRIYCGGLASVGEVLICGWKLEEGDTATPWCETTYSPSNISNIVYDCSGFGNHGTIIGTPSIDTTSPRFNSAIAMNCVSNANHIQTNKAFLLPMNEQSVSFWAYTNLTSTYVLYIDPQLSFCVNSAGTGIYTSRASAKGFAASAFPTGQWNHVVLIRSGTTHKMYINGINIPQNFNTNNNWTHNVQLLYLFNRSYNNNYGANAALCDFRVYATVLSDDDILDLYHTSAAIDKNGNGYAREEIEDSNLNITKTGQFHNGELLDSNDYTTASITKTDKQLKVNNFYEY